jgi:hypothetical protein
VESVRPCGLVLHKPNGGAGRVRVKPCYGKAQGNETPTHPATKSPTALGLSAFSFPHYGLGPPPPLLACAFCPCARHTRRNRPPTQPGEEDLRRLLFASLRIGGETSLPLMDFPSARSTGLGIRMYVWTDRSSLGGGFDSSRMLPTYAGLRNSLG